MAFAQLGIGIGASRVEIAEADGFEAVGRAVVGQDLLHHKLAAAIGVDGRKGVAFRDWHGPGIAIDGRG